MVKSLPHTPQLLGGSLLCHARLREGTHGAAWGTRCSHTDAPVPPGHHHPLPTGPSASCRGTKLTRFPWRCLLYRWCLLFEGDHSRLTPGGETLLAKPFFGGASYIFLTATGPLALCENPLQTQPMKWYLQNYLHSARACACGGMHVDVCVYRYVGKGRL